MIYKTISMGIAMLTIFLIFYGLLAMHNHEYLRSIASGILSVSIQMLKRSIDEEYERNHSINP